jgi:hypothetical protein
MTNVYILIGSEDGMMGAYRKKADAISAGRKYVQQSSAKRIATHVDNSEFVTFVTSEDSHCSAEIVKEPLM